MKLPKLAIILCALFVAQSAFAEIYQYRIASKGVKNAGAPPIVPPVASPSSFEGATLLLQDGSNAGTTFIPGIYYSDRIVSAGVVYFEVAVDSTNVAGDALFGFTEASHTTPNNGVNFRLDGKAVHLGGGVFDVSTFANKTEFSVYPVYDMTQDHIGPATIGFSANFDTHTIKIYYNNVLKYVVNNLPDGIQLRAVKSHQGSGTVRFNKASWSYNPDGL